MKDAKDKEGRSVKILGRAGILFKDGKNEYFVDSEMSVGEFDLVIFSDNVRYFDKTNETPVSSDKKKEIVSMTVKMLQSEGIKVNVT